jgi:hypothetical protein
MKAVWTTILLVCVAAMALAAVAGAAPTSWVVPSSEKVYPDSLPPTPAYEAALWLARGEYGALQVGLRSDTDLQDLRVAVVPRYGKGETTNAAAWAELFEALYVPTPADGAHPVTPDPLVPLKGSNRESVSLKAGETKAIWVRFRAPERAAPGAYGVDVLVGRFMLAGGVLTDGKGPFIRVPVTVNTRPFALPRRTHLRTAFGISGGWIARQHGVADGSPAYQELYRKYYEELLAHRICAYEVPYGLADKRAEPYIRSERVNAFTVPYSGDPEQIAKAWKHVQDLGAVSKAWVYPSDEPVGRAAYDGLKAQAAAVHRAAPGLKVCSPFFRGPDWDAALTPFDELVGSLDIWCVNTGYYNDARIQDLLAERQKAGEEAWCYVCCGPGSPFCNFFVNMSALQHRLLLWQLYHYGVTGLLYWSTTWWNPPSTEDPYADIATVKDINPSIYGDGSLFYPGAKVGVDGPVTSIRLECIRDGLQDYEYLVLARRAFGEQAVQDIVGKAVTDMLRYCTSAREFEAVRRRLGDALAAETPKG